MTAEMDGDSDGQSLPDVILDSGRNCDNLSPALAGGWEQIMMTGSTELVQKRILRSVSRNCCNERSRRSRITTSETTFYSDDENALVIDIDHDSSNEDVKILQSSDVITEPLKQKKYSLRPKVTMVCNVLNETQEHVGKKKPTKLQNKRKRKSEGEPNMKKLKVDIKEEPSSADESQVVVKKVSSRSTGEANLCPICDMVFNDAHSFTIHIREHNTDKKVCSVCSKILSSQSSLDRHMIVHTGERAYQCETCDQTFTTNGNMNRHRRVHLKNNTNQANGPKGVLNEEGGSINIGDESSLSKSEAAVPSGEKQKTSKSPLHDKVSPPEAAALSPPHPLQNTKTVIMSEFEKLVDHEISTSKFQLHAMRSKLSSRNGQNSSVSSPILRSWPCRTCHKPCETVDELTHHESTHKHGDMTCTTCSCQFATPETFQVHQFRHTPSPSKLSDPELGIPKESFFSALGLLPRPEENVQPETKPLDINRSLCRDLTTSTPKKNTSENVRDFADISSIVSLTNETPLPDLRASPEIAYTTQRVGDISPAVEGSANTSTETEHNALDCVPSCSKQRKKKIYNCQICKDSFSNKTVLKSHLKIHAKKTLYQCELCPYNTTDRSTLNRHSRRHNGEHPFICTQCSCQFTTRANAHRHARNKHKLCNSGASKVITYNTKMMEIKCSGNGSNAANRETICKYCHKDFKFNRALRHHLRAMNNSCESKPFTCDICNVGFSTKNNCIRHITKSHETFKSDAKKLAIPNGRVVPDNNETSKDAAETENTPKKEDDRSEGVKLEENEDSVEPSCRPELVYAGTSVEKSDAELSVAKSLVSLQELAPPPPQEKPLDLTLRVLNLSHKTEESEVPHSLEETSFPHISVDAKTSGPISPQANSQKLAIEANTPRLETDVRQSIPLNLSHSKPVLKSTAIEVCLVSNLTTGENYNAHHIPIVCFPSIVSPVNGLNGNKKIPLVITPKIFLEKNSNNCITKQKPAQKAKRFYCEYCQKGFTIKSNRERHVKNHHPEHARPPRSRNYIPTLSSVNIQKQSNPTLSEKTRDALRVRLISKSSNKGQKFENYGKLSVQMEASVQASTQDTEEVGSANSDIILDLASVSDVIDTVNCQSINRYLTQAKELPENAIDSVNESDNVNGTQTRNSSPARCRNGIVCRFCKKTFPWSSSLSRHLLTHTGIKPHGCPECKMRFTTKSNRDRHLVNQHKDMDDISQIGSKSYRCNICKDGLLRTRVKLLEHYQSKHPGKQCPTDNGFSTMQDSPSENPKTDNVELSSSGESSLSNDAFDNLECHVCGDTLPSQDKLLDHLNTVHLTNCESRSEAFCNDENDSTPMTATQSECEGTGKTNNNCDRPLPTQLSLHNNSSNLSSNSNLTESEGGYRHPVLPRKQNLLDVLLAAAKSQENSTSQQQ